MTADHLFTPVARRDRQLAEIAALAQAGKVDRAGGLAREHASEFPADAPLLVDTGALTRFTGSGFGYSPPRPTDPTEETTMNDRPDEDGVIEEPPNSTVDDWMGQRVERDTKLAEDLLEETGDPAEAERRFDQEAEKERPEDLPTEERRT